MQKILGILAVSVLLSASCIRRRSVLGGPETVGNTVYIRSVGGGSILSLTPRADTSLTRSFRRRARPKCRALAGFLAFPSSRARSSRTCAAALTCSSGRTSSAPTRLSRPRRTFLIPRPTASSAFATWLGTTPSTGSRNSPGAILNATGSRRRPTPPSTRISQSAGPGSFNLGDDDAGICRDGPRRQAPPIVSLRLTPKARGGVASAHPSISAVTCAATERASPSRS